MTHHRISICKNYFLDVYIHIYINSRVCEEDGGARGMQVTIRVPPVVMQ